MRRRIPKLCAAVWLVQLALFAGTLFTGNWWMAAFTLAWFAVWETVGVVRPRKGDTLSESVWAILDVQDNAPVNRALYPLVMGVFCGAGILFVGLVAGVRTREMGDWSLIGAAVFVAVGALCFLFRHFRRGDSR